MAGDLFSTEQKLEAQLAINNYFEHVQSLRENVRDQLEQVEGRVFVYRLDGTDQTRYVWNMRLARPPRSFLVSGETWGLVGVLDSETIGCRFPEPNDIVVRDLTPGKVGEVIEAQVVEAWAQPMVRNVYADAFACLMQAVDNTCRGDLPFDVENVTPEMRVAAGWDVDDSDGNPWVEFGGRKFMVKTPRLAVGARAFMHQSKLASVPLYEGMPGAPGSRIVGVFEAGALPNVVIDPEAPPAPAQQDQSAGAQVIPITPRRPRGGAA